MLLRYLININNYDIKTNIINIINIYKILYNNIYYYILLYIIHIINKIFYILIGYI